jgi:hypothetical protein
MRYRKEQFLAITETRIKTDRNLLVWITHLNLIMLSIRHLTKIRKNLAKGIVRILRLIKNVIINEEKISDEKPIRAEAPKVIA